MRFVKGHGTRNDFVLIPPGELPGEPSADLVRRLCDRRAGIGADGVLRVVAAEDADVAMDGARWFMDYRNADGSVAEMCGNGIRVFARYLVDAGLESPGQLRIATRDGVKKIDVPASGDITVGMGVPARLPDAKAIVGGVAFDGAGWSMGNPHLVVLDVDDLASLDLSGPPLVDPADAFSDGVNIEFVHRLDPARIAMRVHERGVGETQSCGTGVCAAAVAAMAVVGERTTYQVDVPGGSLSVKWCDGGNVLLTGPAVLVAEGDFHLA